jgi:hypothetical protein
MNALAGLYDNPILWKHIRSRLRFQHLVPSVAVVLIICGCVLWGGYALRGLENGGTYIVLLLIQWGVLVVMGTSQTATAVAFAKDSSILDFHRVSPLPASWVTMGFAIGAPVREYVIFAGTLPFSFVPAVMGKPGVAGWGAITVVLVLSAFLFHMLAVVIGLVSRKPRGAGGAVVGIAMLIHFIGMQAMFGGASAPALMTVIPTVRQALEMNDLRDTVPGFFGVEMPLYVQSFIHQLPILVFLYVAAVRKMRSERAHAYSKLGAIAFVATIAVLALGEMWNTSLPRLVGVNVGQWPVLVVLYTVTLASVLLTLAVTPSASGYANGLRRATKHGRQRLAPWSDLAPNTGAVIVFCWIIVLAAVLAQLSVDPAGLTTRVFWCPTAAAMLVVAYFGFARQYFDVNFGRRGQPFFLLFLFVVWLMPLIVGSILALTGAEEGALPVFSLTPLVGIGASAVTTRGGFDDEIQISVLLSSLTFAVIFAALSIASLRRAWRAIELKPPTDDSAEPEPVSI